MKLTLGQSDSQEYEDPFSGEVIFLCISKKVVECCLQENMKFESKGHQTILPVTFGQSDLHTPTNSYTEKNPGKLCTYGYPFYKKEIQPVSAEEAPKES